MSEANGEALRFALIIGVPNAMQELRLNGGPTEADYAQASAFGQTLAERGDDLLYKSKKQGETARLCADLIRALAVAAFVPGGVTLFGLHFDAGTPDNTGRAHCNTLEGPYV